MFEVKVAESTMSFSRYNKLSHLERNIKYMWLLIRVFISLIQCYTHSYQKQLVFATSKASKHVYIQLSTFMAEFKLSMITIGLYYISGLRDCLHLVSCVHEGYQSSL